MERVFNSENEFSNWKIENREKEVNPWDQVQKGLWESVIGDISKSLTEEIG